MKHSGMAALLSVLILMSACVRYSQMERDLIDGPQAARQLDAKILDLVKNLVRTIRPDYRVCDRALFRVSREGKQGIEVRRTDGGCKYNLGFLDISDIDRTFVGDMHKYFTERILAFSFLQDVISKNYVIVERLTLEEIYEISAENDDEPRYPEEIEKILSDILEKNKAKRDPIEDNNLKWLQQKYQEEQEEKKARRIKAPEPLSPPAKETPKADAEKGAEPEIPDFPKDKIHPEFYESAVLAKLLGQRFDLDVIETGFIVEYDDFIELNLRMIETTHGQIIAVGSTRIPRALLFEERQ